MRALRVMLAGEGRNELGDWAIEAVHRQGRSEPGVVEALLRRVRADGWAIEHAICWKDIRKFRAGRHGDADKRGVLGLVLQAKEAGVDVVAFVRDRDGQVDRVGSIEAGISAAAELIAEGPRIAGGIAVRTLESWILALAGRRRSEACGPTQTAEALAAIDVKPKDTRGMVAVVERARLDALPVDAASLRTWLARAEDALTDGP